MGGSLHGQRAVSVRHLCMFEVGGGFWVVGVVPLGWLLEVFCGSGEGFVVAPLNRERPQLNLPRASNYYPRGRMVDRAGVWGETPTRVRAGRVRWYFVDGVGLGRVLGGACVGPYCGSGCRPVGVYGPLSSPTLILAVDVLGPQAVWW
ncbi:hypothetical protein Tco_0706933 [Tanacetum coccineum]|uniref:Uncharacterized protein n=1 Tax=Tanacetum coccineum TaxID=301880 RepID=A0ABQ4YAE7_9ASTR